MFNRDFISSDLGVILQYRKRRRHGLLLHWVGTFETKKSRRPDNDVRFQEWLLSEMERHKRRCFRGPIVIELLFIAGSKDPPAVHSLAKHYLDLFQAPLPGVNTDRTKLLIADDELIRLLNCSYQVRDTEAGQAQDQMYIRVSYAQKLCFEKLKKVAYSFNRKTERKYANEERYSDGTEKARGIS